jgi:hypothetical protein
MKRILTFIIIGFFCLKLLSAQEVKNYDFHFNIGANITIPYSKNLDFYTQSRFLTDSIGDYLHTQNKANFGYFIELFNSNEIADRFSLGFGLNYSFNRFSVVQDYELAIFYMTQNISYIHIPISVKYRLIKKPIISLSAGGLLGLIISAKEKGTFNWREDHIFNSWEYHKYEFDFASKNKDILTRINYGLLIQLDYEFSISQAINGITFTRLNYGLKDIMMSDHVKWKNYDIMLGIGLIL